MEVYVMVLNENKEILKPTFAEVLSAEILMNFQPMFNGYLWVRCRKV